MLGEVLLMPTNNMYFNMEMRHGTANGWQVPTTGVLGRT